MSLDIHQMCVVCAWREKCTKKLTMKETAMHCPDFTRDATIPADDAPAKKAGPGHKKIVDPFA